MANCHTGKILEHFLTSRQTFERFKHRIKLLNVFNTPANVLPHAEHPDNQAPAHRAVQRPLRLLQHHHYRQVSGLQGGGAARKVV